MTNFLVVGGMIPVNKGTPGQCNCHMHSQILAGLLSVLDLE